MGSFLQCPLLQCCANILGCTLFLHNCSLVGKFKTLLKPSLAQHRFSNDSIWTRFAQAPWPFTAPVWYLGSCEPRSATERIFSTVSEKAISSGVPGLRIRQDNIQYAAVHANVCMLRGIWPYSHCLQRRNLCQSRPLQAWMGGREVRRVKASAWNFGLFPNPVFAMRIIVSYFANTRRRPAGLGPQGLRRWPNAQSLFEGLGEGIKLFYAHHRFRAIFQLS